MTLSHIPGISRFYSIPLGSIWNKEVLQPIDIVVGPGSSVIDFEIRNTGYGYGNGDTLTIPVGGIYRNSNIIFFFTTSNQFELTVEKS